MSIIINLQGIDLVELECRMKINFNCCPKPALFKQNDGMTLFKGEKTTDEPAAKIKPEQPPKDTVEVSKQPECKCTCECKGCK